MQETVRNVNPIPGLGRSPGGGNGHPLQYCCLENYMDRGTWRAMVHRVTKNWTQLKQLSTEDFKSPFPKLSIYRQFSTQFEFTMVVQKHTFSAFWVDLSLGWQYEVASLVVLGTELQFPVSHQATNKDKEMAHVNNHCVVHFQYLNKLNIWHL